MAETRKAAIGAFAGLGLPHRRIEEWKYTDLRAALREAAMPAVADATPVTAAELDAALEGLAALDAYRVVFVNGVYRQELSSTELSAGLSITLLARTLEKSGLSQPQAPAQDATIALNTAFVTDGAAVEIAQRAKLAKPLLVVFVRAGSEPRLITTRNVIKAGDDGQVTLIEAHVALAGASAGQANTLRVVMRRGSLPARTNTTSSCFASLARCAISTTAPSVTKAVLSAMVAS